MGADLIIATCPAPKIVAGDDVDVETVGALAKAVLRQRIEAMSDDAVILAVDNAGYAFDYEDGDDPSETAALIRFDLVTDEHLDLLDTDVGREVSILNLGGATYLITGGMSWGDDPTDAFKWICIYAETGITSGPIRLGTAGISPLVARCAGITVELGAPRSGKPGGYEGGRVVDSIWREPGESARLAAALDTVERLVLAHAIVGVDVESTAYLEGMETVLDGITREEAG
ncbi:MAG: hypothetical protein ACYCS4_07965 [Acidimicrobiales bacterium]